VAGVVLASQAWVPLLFSLGVGPLAQPAAAQIPGKPQSILLVTYAVTKAAYDKIIPLFVELPNQSVATNSTVATVAPAESPKPSAVSYTPRPPRRSSSTMASGR
jgi:ABC-type sulfate transport system substrate-binding protein